MGRTSPAYDMDRIITQYNDLNKDTLSTCVKTDNFRLMQKQGQQQIVLCETTKSMEGLTYVVQFLKTWIQDKNISKNQKIKFAKHLGFLRMPILENPLKELVIIDDEPRYKNKNKVKEAEKPIKPFDPTVLPAKPEQPKPDNNYGMNDKLVIN